MSFGTVPTTRSFGMTSWILPLSSMFTRRSHGPETIYTFHIPTGDEEIASCKVAIDENHPLFRAVAAALTFQAP